jgi:hypothetical protein
MPSLIAAFGGDEKFDAWGARSASPGFPPRAPIGVGDPLAQMHELETRLNEVGLFIAAEITGVLEDSPSERAIAATLDPSSSKRARTRRCFWGRSGTRS